MPVDSNEIVEYDNDKPLQTPVVVLETEKARKKGPKQIAPIFECEIFGCNQAFKTKYSLKRHYYKHYSKQELKCRFCPKKFCLPQYKKEHEYTHTGEKPYVCPQCPMRFRQRGKLSQHRKLCQNRVLEDAKDSQPDTMAGNSLFNIGSSFSGL